MHLLLCERDMTRAAILATKKLEHDYLRRGRNILGIYNKKHGPDDEYPEMTEAQVKAFEWATTPGNEVAAEAQTEEAYAAYWGLTHHRKNVLRKHARLVHLALHFLRGKPYATAEHIVHEVPNFDNIEILLFNLTDAGDKDPQDLKQRFEEWIQNARAWIKPEVVQQEEAIA